MARRYRRRRSGVRRLAFLVVAVTIFGGGYLGLVSEPSVPPSEMAEQDAASPSLRTDRPVSAGNSGLEPMAPERGSSDRAASQAAADQRDRRRAASLLVAGREELVTGKWIAARQHLSEAMQLGVEPSELPQLRADLTRIGDETVFSSRVYDQDPLVGRHIIQPGETLGIIAQRFEITAGILGRINGIKDVNRIRAGQTIKIIHGPFHVDVNKKRHRLDVLLGTTYVRTYRVGLGADDSTPTGTWKVASKLENPAFYPPRTGRIISADDPKNPLGEHWIGLEGLGGEALGQLRYGIHGTIEPDSIGRSVSLGCIRMHNADVAFLFDLMVVDSSRVEVVSIP